MQDPTRLILASGSRYRAAQLASLGLAFDAIAPDIDESHRDAESAEAMVVRLAYEKATAIAKQHPDAIVIGSDQLACLDGRIIGKPGSETAARQQLAAASGRTIDFLTAVHVVAPGVDDGQALVVTRAQFRELDDDEIARYVAADQPLDCAGAFKVESLGISLFERIESDDPTALVGLPLIATARLLRKGGVLVP